MPVYLAGEVTMDAERIAALEQENADLKRLVDQLQGNALRREYPEGRLGADDDGALSVGVGCDKDRGVVIIFFGKPIKWIGLSPKDVANMVKSVVKAAREVSTEPFTVEL
jgi:hypothetical protein